MRLAWSWGEWPEHNALVGKIEPEGVAPEQVPSDDTIHRCPASAQVTQILDDDLRIDRALRAVHQLGQDAPLDLHGLIKTDHSAGTGRQIEALGELAVD